MSYPLILDYKNRAERIITVNHSGVEHLLSARIAELLKIASSMSNISFFFPKKKQGFALGI